MSEGNKETEIVQQEEKDESKNSVNSQNDDSCIIEETDPEKIDEALILSGAIRLTPTGKISRAKTRVYTQRYRKEWEHTPDFRDWLQAVPKEATRAHCKFCQRNLHAHRLSLLKHMCTLKHQRAAVQYSKAREVAYMQRMNNDGNEEEEEEDEDEVCYEEGSFVPDDSEHNEEMEVQEGMGTESDENENDIEHEREEEEEEEEEMEYKNLQILKKDPDEENIMESNHQSPNNENPEYQMMESENENDEANKNAIKIIKCASLASKQPQIPANRVIRVNAAEIKMLNSGGDNQKSTSNDANKKLYFFSAGGKSYTLMKSPAPFSVVKSSDKNIVSPTKKTEPSILRNTKNEFPKVLNSIGSKTPVSSPMLIMNTHTAAKSVLIKKQPNISTHVIEASKGYPMVGLQVSLYKLQEGRWTYIYESTTTAAGNCNDFTTNSKLSLTAGRYKLHYDTEKYYNVRKISTIYPFIEIVFDVKDPNGTYHIPLLLTPFSYSTYKDQSL